MFDLTIGVFNIAVEVRPENGWKYFKSVEHVANYVETIRSFLWVSLISRKVVNMENVQRGDFGSANVKTFEVVDE